MRPPELSRRAILKGGVAAATVASTTHGLTPRKTFAAREQKLVFWLQPNFNATADRILEEQIRAYAKQAGLKDQEVQILKVPGGEIATRMTAALEVGAPPDITRTSEFLLPRWKSQGHLLDITDLMGEMRQAAGGINPAVVPLAQAHFDLQPERFHLVPGDGRYFVNCATKKYDAVILDAFLGDSSPSNLMTREAFDAMRRVLRPDGVLVINSFGDFSRDKDFLTASLDKTLKAVFRSVRIHASGNGNVFFVASDQPDLAIRNPPDLELAHPTIRHQVQGAFASIQQVNPRHGRVLTDDFNPVEFYDAANREAIRRQLASAMRRR